MDDLKSWLRPDESLTSGIFSCIKMSDCHRLKRPEKGISIGYHILWSGAASDCVIVGISDNTEIILAHLTQKEFEKGTPTMVTELLIFGENKHKSDGQTNIYITSSNDKKAREIETVFRVLGFNNIRIFIETNSSKGGRLAIDALNGRYSFDFDYAGLPR